MVSDVDALLTVQYAPFHPSPYESTVCMVRHTRGGVGAGETDGSGVGAGDGKRVGAGVVGAVVGAGEVGLGVGAAVVGIGVVVGELLGDITLVMVTPSRAISPS